MSSVDGEGDGDGAAGKKKKKKKKKKGRRCQLLLNGVVLKVPLVSVCSVAAYQIRQLVHLVQYCLIGLSSREARKHKPLTVLSPLVSEWIPVLQRPFSL